MYARRIKFSLNINGELVGFFNSQRGLRQGDPLSSYLFVLVIEALSRLIQKRVAEDPEFVYHWRCTKTKLTHLCFADDMMLFCGNSIQSAEVINRALGDFSNMSGLCPNRQKSSLYIAGSDKLFNDAIHSVFQFHVWELPIKYLGLPLLSSRLSEVKYKPLIDSILSRLKGWTVRPLSFAGRL